MSKEKFVEKCVKLCSMDDKDIIKTILNDNLNYILETKNDEDKQEQVNFTDVDVFKYKPTKHTFPDFAFFLCTSGFKREDLLKNIISNGFDEVVNEKRSASQTEGRRTRSRVSTQNKNLPSILSLFTTKSGDIEVMSCIDNIVSTYFTGYVQITDNIYTMTESSSYVIVVSDLIESWRSSGKSNILSWKMSESDYSEVLFTRIIHSLSTIHIIRKRNGEFRYMGKCQRVSDIDEKSATCVMRVC